MARCCPDELNPEAWGEDAPYIWAQVLAVWGDASLEATVMRARFGFDGATRESADAVGARLGLKAYRVNEAVQQVLQRIPFVRDRVDVCVLYEDEHLLALAKPPHVSVTPRNRSRGGAMLNRALHHLQPEPLVLAPRSASTLVPRTASAAPEPFVVHRLDYNTSGVLLFAKTSAAAGRISAQFREPGRVRKVYLALCGAQEGAAATEGARDAGSPDWFEVAAPLGREDRSRQGVRADGKEASTWFRLLAATERAGGGGGSDALVACRPLTGRTHQIRVHAAHAGLPLLGDDVYGVATPLLERHALHAWRISLDHPFSGERLDISAPLPDDFARAMSELGLLLPEGAEALVDVFRPGE